MNNEDKKILEQFPPYDDSKPETYVGSREYWENVFKDETNRDPKLHEDFSKLHEHIVNEVIQFCKEHGLEVDEFSVGADGLLGSKHYGEWCPCTDSYMSMYTIKKDEDGHHYVDREKPFLHEI